MRRYEHVNVMPTFHCLATFSEVMPMGIRQSLACWLRKALGFILPSQPILAVDMDSTPAATPMS